jgi:hypothetical protein
MDDEPGTPLSQRSNFYALLDAAIACGTPCVHAPPVYDGDLEADVNEYIKANATEENGLWAYRVFGRADLVIAGRDNTAALTIVRPAAGKRAA